VDIGRRGDDAVEIEQDGTVVVEVREGRGRQSGLRQEGGRTFATLGEPGKGLISPR
jgi:hypothetical protein